MSYIAPGGGLIPDWLVRQTSEDERTFFGPSVYAEIPDHWQVYRGRGIELCIVDVEKDGEMDLPYSVCWGVEGESAEGVYCTDSWIKAMQVAFEHARLPN